jgi:hypothetical protein
MRQQRSVVSVLPAEVVDQEVRRREHGREESEDERRHEEGDDHEDDEDRQRRAHQQSDEHDGRHLGAAEGRSGSESCQRGVVLELVGAWDRVGGSHVFTFPPAWASSRLGECRVKSLVGGMSGPYATAGWLSQSSSRVSPSRASSPGTSVRSLSSAPK